MNENSTYYFIYEAYSNSGGEQFFRISDFNNIKSIFPMESPSDEAVENLRSYIFD